LLAEYIAAIEASGISVTRSMNPLQSDINLYPETLAGIGRRICGRLGLPFSLPMPGFLLAFAGRFVATPGRLYSFVGVKRHE